MNLYLLSQDKNQDYDTYDSCVVAAESADEARNMLPADGEHTSIPSAGESEAWARNYWASPEHVSVRLVGVAKEGIQAGEVICASFNAG